MSYTINNTDGSILLTLGDGKVDKVTTSLSLIGKNVNSYGEYLNNNLVRLLENFANTESPNSPIVGQLWYDTGAGRLKIYDVNQIFRPVSNTIISDTLPLELSSTDFWFDTTTRQMFFSTDGQTTDLIGPENPTVYRAQGWKVETLTDTGFRDRVVTSLYNNGTRVGILSTSSFTLETSTSGFVTVGVGLNLNPSITGMRFVGTATSADSLSGFDITRFIRKGINETTTGSLIIANNGGLSVQNSSYQGISINVNAGSQQSIISSDSTDFDLNVKITNGVEGLISSVYVDAANKRVGIWNTTPSYQLDVTGDARVSGNLYVEGTTTNVTSVNLQVYDKNIELGYGVNLDSGVDGGGITLHGTTDKVIQWRNNGTGWNFSDKINIQSATDSYYINGSAVLNRTSLGDVVTSAPGLQTIGIMSSLRVQNMLLTGNTISSTGTNLPLRLSANGTGTIDVTNLKITSVATPTNNQDAANKKYVDDQVYLVGTKAYGLTIDVTNFSAIYGSIEDGITTVLNYMFPVVNNGTYNTTSTDVVLNIPDGVRAKVLAGITTVSTSTASPISFQPPYGNVATIQVDQGGIQNSATVVSGALGAIAASLPPQSWNILTTYQVWTFRVALSQWTLDTVVNPPIGI
jgi:hypothetical protein